MHFILKADPIVSGSFMRGRLKNRANKSIWITLPVVLCLLYSYVSAQQDQGEPKDADFYKNQGLAYHEKRQYDQAISDFTKALKINPKDPYTYFCRGNAYAEKSQYDQAIDDFTKALEIDPKAASTYYHRAIAYYFKKEYDKSWKDLKKAEDLGYKIPTEFLESLRKASGKQS